MRYLIVIVLLITIFLFAYNYYYYKSDDEFNLLNMFDLQSLFKSSKDSKEKDSKEKDSKEKDSKEKDPKEKDPKEKDPENVDCELDEENPYSYGLCLDKTTKEPLTSVVGNCGKGIRTKTPNVVTGSKVKDSSCPSVEYEDCETP